MLQTAQLLNKSRLSSVIVTVSGMSGLAVSLHANVTVFLSAIRKRHKITENLMDVSLTLGTDFMHHSEALMKANMALGKTQNFDLPCNLTC